MFFIIKVLISGGLIAFASLLAGKKPILAGFIIALPLTSLLGILFAYVEHQNMDKINQFALSIVVAVPLSMVFFVPFLANKWLKMNFAQSFTAGLILLAGAYFLHSTILKT